MVTVQVPSQEKIGRITPGKTSGRKHVPDRSVNCGSTAANPNEKTGEKPKEEEEDIMFLSNVHDLRQLKTKVIKQTGDPDVRNTGVKI